ncbi:unnamed protein product [Larinioides sclopetarius]|uniref:Neurotransmitter-gated ion-channel ligand-binding domain-containing protein n=1 Tax=Larinioides sclopetarius TaxID=280406 RepID=A0AAV2B575_9ARAC
MYKIYSYLACRMNLFFLLFILFYGVTALDEDGSRSNRTIFKAFQNDFSQAENRIKSHSIRSSESPKQMGHLVLIDKLLVDYDKMAWPTIGTNQPTLVTVNIYINSLGSVSAGNMDFGMDIYLRQSWVDPRLQLRKFGVNETITLNGEDLIDEIWTPDIFFRNLKSGNFHSMTVPNKLIKLSPDGRILFSMRSIQFLEREFRIIETKWISPPADLSSNLSNRYDVMGCLLGPSASSSCSNHFGRSDITLSDQCRWWHTL